MGRQKERQIEFLFLSLANTCLQEQLAGLQMDLVELDVRRAREAEKVISNIDSSILTAN